MVERRKRKSRRKIDTMSGLIERQRHILQRMAWERAKGELNGLIALCEGPDKYCPLIVSRIQDAILVVENLLGEGQK